VKRNPDPPSSTRSSQLDSSAPSIKTRKCLASDLDSSRGGRQPPSSADAQILVRLRSLRLGRSIADFTREKFRFVEAQGGVPDLFGCRISTGLPPHSDLGRRCLLFVADGNRRPPPATPPDYNPCMLVEPPTAPDLADRGEPREPPGPQSDLAVDPTVLRQWAVHSVSFARAATGRTKGAPAWLAEGDRRGVETLDRTAAGRRGRYAPGGRMSPRSGIAGGAGSVVVFDGFSGERACRRP
jgi:hypothetical protein